MTTHKKYFTVVHVRVIYTQVLGVFMYSNAEKIENGFVSIVLSVYNLKTTYASQI